MRRVGCPLRQEQPPTPPPAMSSLVFLGVCQGGEGIIFNSISYFDLVSPLDALSSVAQGVGILALGVVILALGAGCAGCELPSD